MKNTTAIGSFGEQTAAEYLKKKGYKIIERNARYCGCEVDIICECRTNENGEALPCKSRAKGLSALFSKQKSSKETKSASSMQTNSDGEKQKKFKFSKQKGNRVIVFCEVKTRCGEEYGAGIEAVTPYKVGRYVTAAKAYCSQKFSMNVEVRFDIIEVSDRGVLHIPDAFSENDAKYPRKSS